MKTISFKNKLWMLGILSGFLFITSATDCKGGSNEQEVQACVKNDLLNVYDVLASPTGASLNSIFENVQPGQKISSVEIRYNLKTPELVFYVVVETFDTDLIQIQAPNSGELLSSRTRIYPCNFSNVLYSAYTLDVDEGEADSDMSLGYEIAFTAREDGYDTFVTDNLISKEVF